MALTLNLSSLRSRRISTKLKAERALSRAPVGGIIRRAFSALARFGGWAFGKVVSYFNLDFDKIWDVLVDAYFELKEFDFNSTDKELQKQIEENNKQLETMAARSVGEQVGIGTVRLVTAAAGRFIPGKKAGGLRAAEGIKIPVLSKRLALDLADEQKSQLRTDTLVFLESASRVMASNALINAVLFTRKFELFGFKPIKNEIEANGSIASKIEKKIEKLPKRWQGIVNAFGDGFEDGVIQAGYVVASTADDEIALMRAERDRLKNDRAVVTLEVNPGGDDGGDTLKFVGTRDEIAEAVPTAMALAPAIQGAGNPAIPATWALRPGSDRPQLVVRYRAQNKSASTHTLHVPHYSGPRTPKFPDYDAGQWLGIWTLSDGSKLQVYAATEREAGVMMRALSKGVPRKFKTGRPRYVNSDRRILKKAMKYVGCAYYANGIEGGVTWKGYRN